MTVNQLGFSSVPEIYKHLITPPDFCRLLLDSSNYRTHISSCPQTLLAPAKHMRSPTVYCKSLLTILKTLLLPVDCWESTP